MQIIATGASVAAQHDGAATRSSSTEYKFCSRTRPNFIGVAKGEDKLRAKVNEIIAGAKTDGRPRQDVAEVARAGRRAGDLPQLTRRARRVDLLDFGAVLVEWPLLLRGVALTLGLTAVAAMRRRGARHRLRLGARLRAGAGCAWSSAPTSS